VRDVPGIRNEPHDPSSRAAGLSPPKSELSVSLHARETENQAVWRSGAGRVPAPPTGLGVTGRTGCGIAHM